MSRPLALPERPPPQRGVNILHFCKPVMTLLRDEHPLPIAACFEDLAAQKLIEGYGRPLRRAEVRR